MDNKNLTYTPYQNKKLDVALIADYFNQFSQLVSGVNTIISPEANAQKANEAEIQKQKDKRNFKIFLGAAGLIVVCLLIYVFSTKTKVA